MENNSNYYLCMYFNITLDSRDMLSLELHMQNMQISQYRNIFHKSNRTSDQQIPLVWGLLLLVIDERTSVKAQPEMAMQGNS